MTKLEQIALFKEQMRGILSKAKAEKRELTDDEQAKFKELETQKNQLAIDEALRSLEVEAVQIAEKSPSLQFAKAVSDIVHQRSLSGYGSSVDPRGITISKRAGDPVVDTAAATSMISTTIGDVIKPLEKGLIINKLGIKMQSGVVGNLQFPTLAAIEATIEGENTRVVPQKLDINNIKASPWRVAVSIRVSNDAIDETNDELFGLVIEQLAMAKARTLNKVMFAGAKVGKASPGVFVKDAPNVQFVGDNPTFAEAVALETAATAEGVDVSDPATAYICHPKMYGILKSTPVEKGNPKMIIEGGMMNGYPVHMTAYMDEGALGFGVFSYSAIGQWGKIRLTVDTTSHADTNETKFTLNSKYDIVQAYKEAFTVGKKKSA